MLDLLFYLSKIPPFISYLNLILRDEFDGVGVRNRLLYYLVIKLMMLLKKRMTLDEVDDVS